MSTLPPLNSVKAFEAAARLGSFVAAAAELGVTAVAVGLQVRNLEFHFGKQLFSRNGNRIALTDAGRSIYPQTSRALNDLANMALQIREGGALSQLVVSVPLSIADLWLAPKLAQMFEWAPHMAIDVRVEDDPVDLARHRIDVRISYGSYHYPDLKPVPLFHDEVTPLCAPELMYRQGLAGLDIATAHESQFIHTDWGPSYGSHPGWSEWFEKVGLKRRIDPARGRRVGLSSLAITSARMGLGIALAQKTLARQDLEAGRLLTLSAESIPLGHPYCAFVPRTRGKNSEVRQLIEVFTA